MLLPLTVLICFGLSAVSANLCASNQFYSRLKNGCENCTTCSHPNIVIMPCRPDRDTRCGPLSDLGIDWSWMKHGPPKKNRIDKEMTDTFNENIEGIFAHEMHVKEKEKQQKMHIKPDFSKESKESSLADEIRSASNDEIWNKLKQPHKERSKGHSLANELIPNSVDAKHAEHVNDPWESPHFSKQEADQLIRSAPKADKLEDKQFSGSHLSFNKDGILNKKFGMFPINGDDLNNDDIDDDEEEEEEDDDEYDDDDFDEDSVKLREMDENFTPTERFIIDWQTAILAMAVAACFVFFLIISCYSLTHVRNFGSISSYVSKDVEEMQQWLSPKKKNPPSSGIYKTTTEVIHKESGRHCKYLERIISKNAKRFHKNIYQSSHPSVETRPLTSDDPAVHKTNII